MRTEKTGGVNMKADYKNWVPKGMIYGFGAAALGLSAVAGSSGKKLFKKAEHLSFMT